GRPVPGPPVLETLHPCLTSLGWNSRERHRDDCGGRGSTRQGRRGRAAGEGFCPAGKTSVVPRRAWCKTLLPSWATTRALFRASAKVRKRSRTSTLIRAGKFVRPPAPGGNETYSCGEHPVRPSAVPWWEIADMRLFQVRA